MYEVVQENLAGFCLVGKVRCGLLSSGLVRAVLYANGVHGALCQQSAHVAIAAHFVFIF